MLDNQVNLYDDWALGQLRRKLQNYLNGLIEEYHATQKRLETREEPRGAHRSGKKKTRDGKETQDRKDRSSEPSWATVGSHISACQACEDVLYDEDEFEDLNEDIEFDDMPERTGVSGDILNDGILRRFVEGQKAKRDDGTSYRRYAPPNKPKFLEAIFVFLQDRGFLNADDLITPNFRLYESTVDRDAGGSLSSMRSEESKLLFQGDFIHHIDGGGEVERSVLTVHQAGDGGAYRMRKLTHFYRKGLHEDGFVFRQRLDQIRPDKLEEWLGGLSTIDSTSFSWTIAPKGDASLETDVLP